ncbi:MAG: 50S ribosomal protein L21 [candidate division WOR-3 bacterium]
MYAVVKIGGFQYLVKPGEVVTVPKLPGDVGSTVRFEDVLLVRTDDRAIIGNPVVANSYVEASIVDHIRKEKVTVYKFIRRENYRRKKGHRQPMTRIKITKINYEG